MDRMLWVKRVGIAVLLMGTVFTFRAQAKDDPTLPQRKADMIAFVHEGLEYAKKNGKEAFLKELMNPQGMFKRGELYFYAYDFNGVNIAHGDKPHLVGKNLIEMTDKKGLRLIAALRDAAATGSGEVVYYWQNPTTKVVEKKLGYVVKFDDSWWFGSGIYLGDEE